MPFKEECNKANGFHWVESYTKRDGTVVHGHCAADPGYFRSADGLTMAEMRRLDNGR